LDNILPPWGIFEDYICILHQQPDNVDPKIFALVYAIICGKPAWINPNGVNGDE
jgi:hypothetical protein